MTGVDPFDLPEGATVPDHVAQIPDGGRRCTVQPDPLDEGRVCNLLGEEHLTESELVLGSRIATTIAYVAAVLPTLHERRQAAARYHLRTVARLLLGDATPTR